LKFLIRTSGGRAKKRELGLGHVYRCVNLVSELKPSDVYFAVEDYGGVKEVLTKKGYNNILFLKKNMDVSSDIKKTIDFVNQQEIDVLIIDKYKIGIKYVKEVRKFVKTILISDLRNIDYPADLVVNGFIGYKNEIIRNKYGTKCLIGPSFQILNKKFAERNLLPRKKYTLLATFGGFDEKNLVEILLKSLRGYLPKINTKIILGPATSKSRTIELFKRKYKKHLKIVSETANMQKEIADARFGLCSGGITTYEFAAVGIPFAIICQVKHQLITAREWRRKGLALNLGLVNNRTRHKIEELLQNITENRFHKRAYDKRIVDGFGSQRVMNKILHMMH